MKENIILIGSSGFIGKQIKIRLKKKKIISLNSTNINLFSKKSISKMAHKFNNSIIIYAAGKKRTKGDTYNNFQKNISFFFNLLYFFSENTPKKLIFLSSVEVYGEYRLSKKIDEKTEPRPKTLYSLAKLIQEQALKFFATIYKFEYLILRLPGIYGRDIENSSIISKLVKSVDNKHPFQLNSSGKEFRDYVFVNNVANFIYEIINNNFKNLIINIATGKSYKINEIIKFIEINFKKKLNIIRSEKQSLNKEYNLKFDNKLIKKLLPKFQFAKLNQFNYKKEFC